MARRIVLTSESLVRLTCHVTAYRFRLENERHARMAIEIKGLKLQAMTARGHLDRMTKAYAKFNEAAPAHAADVEGMAEQVTEMQSDLEFATNLLGNSSAVSGNGSEPQKPPVVPPNVMAAVGDRNEPMAAPAPPLARPALPKAEFKVDDETKPAILSANDILNEISFKEAGETPATTFPHDL